MFMETTWNVFIFFKKRNNLSFILNLISSLSLLQDYDNFFLEKILPRIPLSRCFHFFIISRCSYKLVGKRFTFTLISDKKVRDLYQNFLSGGVHIYIYICNHENNVPSWLSPQWLCGYLCTYSYIWLVGVSNWRNFEFSVFLFEI